MKNWMKKGDDVTLHNIYYAYDQTLKITKYTNSHHLSPETVFKAVWVLIKGEGHSCCVSTFEPSLDINVKIKMFALWIAWQIIECSNQILILNNISVLILQYDASLHKLIHARIGRIRWQVLANSFYRHLLLNAKGKRPIY